MSGVWVVTNSDLGWDCVVGVFDDKDVTEDDLSKIFVDDAYYFDHHTVEDNLEGYE